MNINEYMLGFSFGEYCLIILVITVAEFSVLIVFNLIRHFVRKRRNKMEWNDVYVVVKNGQWCAYNKKTDKYIKNLNKNEQNLCMYYNVKIIFEDIVFRMRVKR